MRKVVTIIGKATPNVDAELPLGLHNSLVAFLNFAHSHIEFATFSTAFFEKVALNSCNIEKQRKGYRRALLLRYIEFKQAI